MPTIKLQAGSPDCLNALLSLADANVIALPKSLTAAATLADTLAVRYLRLQAEASKQRPDPMDAATNAMLVAVSDDEIVAAGALPAKQRAEQAAAVECAEVARHAADRAARHVQRELHDNAEAIGKLLLKATEDVLDKADRASRIMADASHFSYGDPASLYAADKPVQAAFTGLLPLANQHDTLRRGAVLLAGEAKDWAGVESFEGSGVVHSNLGGAWTWQWRPAGHPVARLVAAVKEAEAVAA